MMHYLCALTVNAIMQKPGSKIWTRTQVKRPMKSDFFSFKKFVRFFTGSALAAITLLMFCGINFAFAQSSTLDLTGTNSSETAAANGAQSPEAIRELVSQLFDEEVQALLLDGLDAVADEQDESSTALTSNAFAFIKNWGLSVFKSSADAIIKFPQLLATQANSISTFVSQRGSSGALRLIGQFLFAILLGFLVEWIVRNFTSKWAHKNDAPINSNSFKESFKFLSLRLFLDIAGIIAFTIVAATVVSKMAVPAEREYFSFVLFNVFVVPRFLMAVVRFLLAPNRPEQRLVHTDDWTAKFVYKHSWGLYLLIGIAGAIIRFNALNGFPPGTVRIAFWAALFVNAYVIYIVWQAREGLKQMLIGKDNDTTPTERKIAQLYP